MSSSLDVEIIADKLGFPEGPVAMPDGSVYVAEIRGERVVRITPDGGREEIGSTGGGPNGIAPGPDGALFVCNNGGLQFGPGHFMNILGPAVGYRSGSIQRIDPANGNTATLYTECDGQRLSAPNDIVFDDQGGFYFTDIGKALATGHEYGGVFYGRADGSAINRVAYPLTSPNGIGLSPDGGTLYVADTGSATLWAYEIIAPGRVQPRPFPSPGGGRLVAGLGGHVWFDSLAVQADGCIVVATLITGHFTVFSPDGAIVRQVRMPDDFPTNICFGGNDMQTAYVTLSETGRVGRLRWPEPGLKLNYAI